MRWHHRLRWRLIGIQFLVVITGVASLFLAVQLLFDNANQQLIQPTLARYIEAPEEMTMVSRELFLAFRRTVLIAVVFAATGASIAGIVASYLLWRTMVTPLRVLADSSQRIAAGRYSERVPIPVQGGEALQQVAVNFNEMADSLAQIEAQRMTLIGNVTHELRTPLTGLKGLVEGIEDGIYAPEPQTFQRISREMDRLTRLIDDIQNLSRAEAAAINLNFERFSLEEAVRQVVAHLRQQARAKDITLEVATPPVELWVWADQDRTAQILTNLINNGIRYTPDGGHVQIRFGRKNNSVYAEVVDDGIGIPAHELDFIFERFYRVDHSRSRQSGGSGVGLTISRHLAWAMAGSLTAASAGVDQGSTFTLTLPLAPA